MAEVRARREGAPDVDQRHVELLTWVKKELLTLFEDELQRVEPQDSEAAAKMLYRRVDDIVDRISRVNGIWSPLPPQREEAQAQLTQLLFEFFVRGDSSHDKSKHGSARRQANELVRALLNRAEKLKIDGDEKRRLQARTKWRAVGLSAVVLTKSDTGHAAAPLVQCRRVKDTPSHDLHLPLFRAIKAGPPKAVQPMALPAPKGSMQRNVVEDVGDPVTSRRTMKSQEDAKEGKKHAFLLHLNNTTPRTPLRVRPLLLPVDGAHDAVRTPEAELLTQGRSRSKHNDAEPGWWRRGALPEITPEEWIQAGELRLTAMASTQEAPLSRRPQKNAYLVPSTAMVAHVPAVADTRKQTRAVQHLARVAASRREGTDTEGMASKALEKFNAETKGKAFRHICSQYDNEGLGGIGPAQLPKVLAHVSREFYKQTYQATAEDVRYLMAKCDANGDGMISRDELAKVIETWELYFVQKKAIDCAVASFDASKDGALQADELLPFFGELSRASQLPPPTERDCARAIEEGGQEGLSGIVLMLAVGQYLTNKTLELKGSLVDPSLHAWMLSELEWIMLEGEMSAFGQSFVSDLFDGLCSLSDSVLGGLNFQTSGISLMTFSIDEIRRVQFEKPDVAWRQKKVEKARIFMKELDRRNQECVSKLSQEEFLQLRLRAKNKFTLSPPLSPRSPR